MPDIRVVLSAEQVAELFAAIDRRDLEAATSYFHDDVEIRLGNIEPVHGKNGFATMHRQFMSTLDGVRHELHDVWHAAENPDIVIVPMTVHYTRTDGSVVALPCSNIFHVDSGLIRRYQVFVDITPVFAAAS